MNKERWSQTLDKIMSQFEVHDHTKEASPDEISKVETIIFSSPLGKIKLIYTSRPVIVEKKIIGAYRRGKSKAQVENVYSETETTGQLEAWREQNGEWEQIDAKSFE